MTSEEMTQEITMHGLGVKMDQNTVAIDKLRNTLVDQVGKLIEAQQGRVPEGFIPLSTYKEHIETYKETFKFFGKIMAIVVLGLFGLSKFDPATLSNISKIWGH